jgi:hypothetical protein
MSTIWGNDCFRLPERLMHTQRVAIVIASVIGVVATFLPWVTAMNEMRKISIDGTHQAVGYVGWFTLLCFGITLTMGLIGEKQQAISRGTAFYGAIVPSAIAAFVGGVHLMRMLDDLAIGEHLGIGMYLVVLAGIAVLVVAITLREKINGKT